MAIREGDRVRLRPSRFPSDVTDATGRVTEVWPDGLIVAEFPQPPYPPMVVSAMADEFILAERPVAAVPILQRIGAALTSAVRVVLFGRGMR